ncbi:hypothetical protein [Acinetobacter sp. P1(2025)]|uniref:hypothetical protein n=1 Tax=Acinetobacter sp. P1(2025) TaxID=3446120 RepID=UPI003F533D7C
MKHLKRITRFILLPLAITLIFNVSCNAADMTMDVVQDSMRTPVEWLVTFLEGTGGLFAAMCGLVIGLYAAVVSQSLWQVACSLVFEMVLHYMPPALMAIFDFTM